MKGKRRTRQAKIRLLEGEKVRLRPVEIDDIPKLLEWDSDPEITRWAGKKFETKDDALNWHLRTSLQHRTYAIELFDGRLIGEIEIVDVSWRVKSGEVRVFIGDKHLWDRGLGEDAVRTLADALFNFTSMRELFLRVDQENVRALRCYQKVGFRAEARLKHEREDGSPRTLLLMKLGRPAEECAGA
jgi:RimJ/RimL family protein N-acetyltransferase